MARFVLPGSNPGLLVRGNIDIDHRPLVRLPNGSIGTVRSSSFGVDNIRVNGKVYRHLEILVPTLGFKGQVLGGTEDKQVAAAIKHFKSSNKHLGMFDTWQHAEAYGRRLHLEQARFYRKQIAKLTHG